MLKKVFLAIECADEKQREAEIRQLFAIVSQTGVKGLLSMQGASVLTQLMRK